MDTIKAFSYSSGFKMASPVHFCRSPGPIVFYSHSTVTVKGVSILVQ